MGILAAPRLRRRRPGLDAGGDRLRTGAAKLVGTAQWRPRNAGDRERLPVEKIWETKMGGSSPETMIFHMKYHYYKGFPYFFVPNKKS